MKSADSSSPTRPTPRRSAAPRDRAQRRARHDRACPALFAGWSAADLTPPAGLTMAGYIARQEASTGVRDPLAVHCLALCQGRTRLLLVCVDWLLVSAELAERWRGRLAARFGLSRSGVIIAATHTHAGPVVPTQPFPLAAAPNRAARAYFAAAERTVMAAAQRAIAALQPVAIDVCRRLVREVGSDRNRPGKLRAQPFLLLRLRPPATTSGQGGAAPRRPGAMAVFGVFACHPTVLGADNTLISGDLHAAIARRLATPAGAEWVAVANGAAANISTRFTRRASTSRELERLAALVVRQVAKPRWRPLPNLDLAASTRRLRLPLRRLSTLPQNGAALPGRPAAAALTRRDVVREEGRHVLAQLAAAPAFARRTLATTATVWRLGPLSLAALPFEIFADTGAFLWRKARMQVVGYANGYWGYLPSRAAAADDYETISSPFPPAADAQLRRALTPHPR